MAYRTLHNLDLACISSFFHLMQIQPSLYLCSFLNPLRHDPDLGSLHWLFPISSHGQMFHPLTLRRYLLNCQFIRWLLLAQEYQEHTFSHCWVSWLVVVRGASIPWRPCGIPARGYWKGSSLCYFGENYFEEDSVKHGFALRLPENGSNSIIGYLNNF